MSFLPAAVAGKADMRLTVSNSAYHTSGRKGVAHVQKVLLYYGKLFLECCCQDIFIENHWYIVVLIYLQLGPTKG